ncbi:MAG: class I SAM-dependent methyltransferase [Nostocaceae cyanobacterium]|nr:class I SAM-dependent methyltransferase [Nostocaceae cyanobacterium]
MLTSSKSLEEVFLCPEESNFYSHCLETLVLNNCVGSESIIEFGSGDGTPVIKSLLRTRFDGTVHGFEINPLACEAANLRIAKHGLSQKYLMYNRSLFASSKPQADYLISNPPYLPAKDNKILQPFLHGGLDGITVTKQLLELGYENVLVMFASYSNPEGIINYARIKGYQVSNFLVSPLTFGYYSSELKVKNRIVELRDNNMAFYSENIYLLAGVLLKKPQQFVVDLSTELVQIMTSL